MNKYTLTIKGADPTLLTPILGPINSNILWQGQTAEYTINWTAETEWGQAKVERLLARMTGVGWRIDSHKFTQTLEIK